MAKPDTALMCALMLQQENLVVFLKSIQEEKEKRRWWVRPIFRKRDDLGEQNLVTELRHDEESFQRYFRMSSSTFDDLLSLVTSAIVKQTTNLRKPISPEQRLSITLRYLATGDSQQTISFNYRIGRSTICGIISETCNAICDALQPTYLKVPASVHEWRKIADEFKAQWNFPHCIGALDGKHVAIQAPPRSGSEYFNYKGFHSIVLMAICDANYRFVMVDIGDSGSQSDGGVFANSTFGKDILQGRLTLPSPEQIRGVASPMPYYLVADAAFPLKENIMRPFPGKFLPEDKSVFNYRLSRARRVIENTFGILTTRWRIFRRPIITTVDKAILITHTACCLHNFLQCRNGDVYCPSSLVDSEIQGQLLSGTWRNEAINGNLLPLGQVSSNNFTRSAGHVRNLLKDYFMTEDGMVPWQSTTVNRH